MRHLFILLIFTAGLVSSAEDLQFNCHPRRDREEPYRKFSVTVFNADSNEPTSEVSYNLYKDIDALWPEKSGIVAGFARSEVYQTHLSSRYRNITIDGGNLGWTWQRDQLQLQKRRGTTYKGLFYFPEGSEELEVAWGETLVLVCERTTPL